MAERLDGPLICGMGPVGLATALVLARAGIRAVMIDAAPGVSEEPRAVVYHAPVVQEFDRLGLLADLQEIGFLKQRYHYWTIDHELLGMIDMAVLSRADTAYPFNLHLGQPDLAKIILRHVLATGLVEARWEHKLVAASQDDQRVEATIETPEGEIALTTPWLVGADGAHSGVRRALGMALEGTTCPEWFVATNLRFDFEAAGFGQSNIIADPKYWAVIPRIDQSDLWRCTYGEEADLTPAQIVDRCAHRLARYHPDLRGIEPEAVSPYRVHDRCAERFRIGRVLLAGDAAHLVNPIGGLGLTGGLLDAFPLGAALAAVMRDAGADYPLDAWATERLRIFREVTSPAALENRRRASENDPERRRADIARWRHLSRDPAAAREALMFTFRMVGDHPAVAHG